MFYYAQLNNKDIVISVFETPTEIIQDDLIRIETLDETLIGKWYNRTTGKFVDAPIHILADHSTDVVNYKDKDVWLNTVLDSKVEAENVYTKTEADNTFIKIGEGGADGKSAYELAVEAGFVGTLAQWLASLRGEKGDKGDKGERGLQGIQGVQGVQGIDGAQGDKGADGESCYQIAVRHGFSGTEEEFVASMKGIKGDKGDNGEKGEKGEQGIAGRDGRDGQQGLPGKDGTDFSEGGFVNGDMVINGDFAVNGIIRNNGSQAFYYNTSARSQTIGTNNALTTNITTSDSIVLNGNKANTANLLPRSTNTFDIGSSAMRYKTIYLVNNPSISSDERLKKNITELDNDTLLNFVKALNVVQYEYKNDDKQRIGVTAQNIIKADKTLSKYFVKLNDKGLYDVDITSLIFALIGAIQKLSDDISKLKN